MTNAMNSIIQRLARKYEQRLADAVRLSMQFLFTEHNARITPNEDVRCRPGSDYKRGQVNYQGHGYRVTWHLISRDVYVYFGANNHAGKAHDMHEALDLALSWLLRHAR
jgi:hypothetical protein